MAASSFKIVDHPIKTYIDNRIKERALDNGGEPPDHSGMDARVTKLEELAQDTRDRLTHIEARMKTFATKSDISSLEATMHKELHGLTWKLIGVSGALVAAVYFVAKHL